MNDVFKANISYNKSESKSSVHNESVEKSSLVSGRNMNIKSKNGSITISGTDVKVGNDLDLSAKKDITIKASEENYSSSNSSSQTSIGLSADLSKGKTANLSISKAGTTGRGNGTNYINSTIDVGGKLKTNSKNLTLSGANVEADKLDIKAQNVVIESKQDKSEREDSSYGGSFSIDLANPSNFSANINGSKGNGEKEWVNKQTTLIARNGGKIDTDSLTNIGAVIGSENEKEKLKVSANKVVVKDLEDKNKYENIGGGISIGTDVPNTSIKHDKVDKEQINRATAINTDFEISGKKTSAEDLGFNTDINKAQEKTKDEEKHLDAELHTDLIGEDKRNEIKYAYKKLGSLKEILNQKKFKESMEGVLLDKFKDEHQKEFNLIKDENLSLEDKQKLAQNLVERYLRENGYQGEILAFSRLFGHEKAHMNTYDEGKKGEETAIHTREKIGSENKNKVFTEEEKADYLNNLRNKYKDQKSIEQQFAEAKLVPEKDKENFFNHEEANIFRNSKEFVKNNIDLLSKMFNKSKKEILNNPDEYAYKYIQETRNKEIYNKDFLMKYQEKLEERIKNERNPYKRKELEKEKFWKMSPSFSIYHNGYITENGEVGIYTKPKNEKWVNEKGEEQIFNIETGRIVKDGINNGTFNIAGNDRNSFNLTDTISHFRLDVNSWENYGIGKDDILTKEQRKILSEMGSKYVSDPIFRGYINLKGGKLTESIYREYLKFEEAYHEQF